VVFDMAIIRSIAGVTGFLAGAFAGYGIGAFMDAFMWNFNNHDKNLTMPPLFSSGPIISDYYTSNAYYLGILLFCVILFGLGGAILVANRFK
jgi:hypothetical protein